MLGEGEVWGREKPSPVKTLAYCPVPVSVAVCGLLGALSTTCSVAEKVFRDLGEKVTLIVQLAFIARLLPQLLVWEN